MRAKDQFVSHVKGNREEDYDSNNFTMRNKRVRSELSVMDAVTDPDSERRVRRKYNPLVFQTHEEFVTRFVREIFLPRTERHHTFGNRSLDKLYKLLFQDISLSGKRVFTIYKGRVVITSEELETAWGNNWWDRNLRKFKDTESGKKQFLLPFGKHAINSSYISAVDGGFQLEERYHKAIVDFMWKKYLNG
jgi:hypothetical protein